MQMNLHKPRKGILFFKVDILLIALGAEGIHVYNSNEISLARFTIEQGQGAKGPN